MKELCLFSATIFKVLLFHNHQTAGKTTFSSAYVNNSKKQHYFAVHAVELI